MKGLGADAEYWNALAEGSLKMQQCSGCGAWHWPAVWRCGECGSWEQGWHEVAPRGRIFTWTRTWHDFGWQAKGLPYVSVIVELDGAGGKRLNGVMADAGEPVRIGQRVTAEPWQFEWEGEAVHGLKWTPVGDESEREAR
ncbi:Zn-ribbon domain-containing OB-fold protein [Cupriavidus sp. IDO]|uniref:Zn-ribbon domain-containing OB-fold protein n=1 Tax=Cupriavidus sp. IDO TaxID=1539142 RepID=UPI0006910712|nr:zinc ribbon domain-containing protein [Cupriavidus sp. IDO]KWR87865.1 hypothetical protein RM96_22990 [Cupriavidus sp. IDO]